MAQESGPHNQGAPQVSFDRLMSAMLGEQGYQEWKSRPEGERVPAPNLEELYEEKTRQYAELSELARHLLGKYGVGSESELAGEVKSRRTQSTLETVVRLRTSPIRFISPPEEGWSSAVLHVNEHFERISYDDPFMLSGRLTSIRVILLAEDGSETADVNVREPQKDDFVFMNDDETALTALQRMRDAVDG